MYHTRKTGKEVTRKEEGSLHYMVVKKKGDLWQRYHLHGTSPRYTTISDGKCFFCAVTEENASHKFPICPIAKAVWAVINICFWIYMSEHLIYILHLDILCNLLQGSRQGISLLCSRVYNTVLFCRIFSLDYYNILHSSPNSR